MLSLGTVDWLTVIDKLIIDWQCLAYCEWLVKPDKLKVDWQCLTIWLTVWVTNWLTVLTKWLTVMTNWWLVVKACQFIDGLTMIAKVVIDWQCLINWWWLMVLVKLLMDWLWLVNCWLIGNSWQIVDWLIVLDKSGDEYYEIQPCRRLVDSCNGAVCKITKYQVRFKIDIFAYLLLTFVSDLHLGKVA